MAESELEQAIERYRDAIRRLQAIEKNSRTQSQEMELFADTNVLAGLLIAQEIANG